MDPIHVPEGRRRASARPDSDLVWEFRDEAPGKQDAPGQAPLRRAGRRWLVVVLGLLLVAAWLGLRYWLGQREVQAAQDVLAVAGLEDQAQANNDLQLMLALQDRSLGDEPLDDLAAVAPPLGGLQPRTRAAIYVTILGDWARLDETTSLRVPPGSQPDTPAEVSFVLPRYYRRTAGGWLRSIPGDDYWGPTQTWTGARLSVQYPQRDQAVIQSLAPALDEVLEQACRDWKCPPELRYLLTFSPRRAALIPPDEAYLTAAQVFVSPATQPVIRSDLAPLDRVQDHTLPSPNLTAIPADAAATKVAVRSYARRLVTGLAVELAGGLSDLERRPAFQTLVAIEEARLGTIAPPVQDAAKLSQSLASGDWQPLAAHGLLSDQPDVPDQARSFVYFISRHFGPAGEATLLANLSAADPPDHFIQSNLGTNVAKFESQWLTEVAQGITNQPLGMGAIEDPSAAAVQPFGVVCGRWIAMPGSSNIYWDTIPGLISRSPDGRWLLVGNGNQTSLTLIDLQTGQRRTMADLPGPVIPTGWSADGQWLSYLIESTPPRTQGADWHTMLRTVDGEQRRELPQWVSWAPTRTPGGWDFFSLSQQGNDWELGMGDVTGREKIVAHTPLARWLADGRLVLIPLSTGPDLPPAGLEVKILDPASGQMRTVARIQDLERLLGHAEGLSFTYMEGAPDGRSLVLVATGKVVDATLSTLWLLDLQSGHLRRFTQDTYDWVSLVRWSPDGQHIAILYKPRGSEPTLVGVFAANGTGGWAALASFYRVAWSADSRWLAVDQGDFGTMLYRADGKAMKRLNSLCRILLVPYP